MDPNRTDCLIKPSGSANWTIGLEAGTVPATTAEMESEARSATINTQRAQKLQEHRRQSRRRFDQIDADAAAAEAERLIAGVAADRRELDAQPGTSRRGSLPTIPPAIPSTPTLNRTKSPASFTPPITAGGAHRAASAVPDTIADSQPAQPLAASTPKQRPVTSKPPGRPKKKDGAAAAAEEAPAKKAKKKLPLATAGPRYAQPTTSSQNRAAMLQVACHLLNGLQLNEEEEESDDDEEYEAYSYGNTVDANTYTEANPHEMVEWDDASVAASGNAGAQSLNY